MAASRLNVYLIKKRARRRTESVAFKGFRAIIIIMKRSRPTAAVISICMKSSAAGRTDGGEREEKPGVSDFAARAPSALVTFKMKRLFSSPPPIALLAIFPFFCAAAAAGPSVRPPHRKLPPPPPRPRSISIENSSSNNAIRGPFPISMGWEVEGEGEKSHVLPSASV